VIQKTHAVRLCALLAVWHLGRRLATRDQRRLGRKWLSRHPQGSASNPLVA
jgi:hypothetical protein